MVSHLDDDLSEITVVSVEQAVAAPYASVRLADAGARVIKVEREEGDFARAYDRAVNGQSAYFVWLNRGKESICLDIKVDEDRALLHKLIAKADIFLHNLRPGLMAEIGFGSAVLRASHPRLITCEITGFGLGGEFSGLKAYDLIVQGEVGLCDITGNETGPARVGISVCDIATGLTAYAAVLQALFKRERTGHGSAIQVALFDSLADWMNVPLLHYMHTGTAPARMGVNHATIAPYGAYRCGDGIDVIFSVQNEREWRQLCDKFLMRPDLVDDSRFADNDARVVHRVDLDAYINDVISKLPSREVMARLESGGVAYGRLNSVAEVAAHPHLRTIRVQTPAGEIRVVAPAPVVDEKTSCARAPVPRLGQHTQSLRAEFQS